MVGEGAEATGRLCPRGDFIEGFQALAGGLTLISDHQAEQKNKRRTIRCGNSSYITYHMSDKIMKVLQPSRGTSQAQSLTPKSLNMRNRPNATSMISLHKYTPLTVTGFRLLHLSTIGGVY